MPRIRSRLSSTFEPTPLFLLPPSSLAFFFPLPFPLPSHLCLEAGLPLRHGHQYYPYLPRSPSYLRGLAPVPTPPSTPAAVVEGCSFTPCGWCPCCGLLYGTSSNSVQAQVPWTLSLLRRMTSYELPTIRTPTLGRRHITASDVLKDAWRRHDAGLRVSRGEVERDEGRVTAPACV